MLGERGDQQCPERRHRLVDRGRQRLDPDRAAAIIQEIQSHPPYNLPGTQVPPSKVFMVYNEEVLAESTAYIGNHLNFLAALEGLGVPEGSKIKNKYEGVKANQTDMAVSAGKMRRP